jgi:hypothetical protein
MWLQFKAGIISAKSVGASAAIEPIGKPEDVPEVIIVQRTSRALRVSRYTFVTQADV